MIRTFKPHMNLLPPAQKRLWPELGNAPRLGFTLYGGTAIALRLGHRDSVDFDLFSEKPLDREAIKAAFPFMAQSTTLQDQVNTWVVLVPSGQEQVKVSLFGKIDFGRVGEPDFTDDGVLQVASFDDLMATEVKVVLQRAQAKDYRDVAAMVNAGVRVRARIIPSHRGRPWAASARRAAQARVTPLASSATPRAWSKAVRMQELIFARTLSLAQGIASARLLYGPNFQPSESLKALLYFHDGDLQTLTAVEQKTLVDAVKAIRDLPVVTRRSTSLSSLRCEEPLAQDGWCDNQVALEKPTGTKSTLR